jgi:hypothetical protein
VTEEKEISLGKGRLVVDGLKIYFDEVCIEMNRLQTLHFGQKFTPMSESLMYQMVKKKWGALTEKEKQPFED